MRKIKNLLSQNSKHKPEKIWAFNLPASAEVCRFAGDCKFDCYAKKGNFVRFPKIMEGYKENEAIARGGNFVNIMSEQLRKKKSAKFIRLHSSGDFLGRWNVKDWFRIIRKHADKEFFAYTKSMPDFKGLVHPRNFWMTQSEGTVNDKKLINRNDSFTVIRDTQKEVDEMVSKGYVDASHSDLAALEAMKLNKNIVLIRH